MNKNLLIKLYKPLAEVNSFPGMDKNWRILNPYATNFEYFEFFANKYYADNNFRNIIFGLNPGRFGCGKTGITFTDEKILKSKLKYPRNISQPDKEKTATRIYSVVEETFGGDLDLFFSKYFMSNIFPFGAIDLNGNNVVFNDLMKVSSVRDFSLDFVENTLRLFNPRRVLCIGLGSHRFIVENFPNIKVKYLHHPARVFPEEKKDIYKTELSYDL